LLTFPFSSIASPDLDLSSSSSAMQKGKERRIFATCCAATVVRDFPWERATLPILLSPQPAIKNPLDLQLFFSFWLVIDVVLLIFDITPQTHSLHACGSLIASRFFLRFRRFQNYRCSSLGNVFCVCESAQRSQRAESSVQEEDAARYSETKSAEHEVSYEQVKVKY
jgi:hypothetical protein